MLPDWIDLIFGRKQQGKAAIEANNVFFYLTYYGSVDVASIEDEGLRQATELQIAHFGQCPMQLFYRRHAKKQAQEKHRRRQTLSDLYDIKSLPLTIQSKETESNADGKEGTVARRLLPFKDAPISYWVSSCISSRPLSCLVTRLTYHSLHFHAAGASWSSSTGSSCATYFH